MKLAPNITLDTLSEMVLTSTKVVAKVFVGLKKITGGYICVNFITIMVEDLPVQSRGQSPRRQKRWTKGSKKSKVKAQKVNRLSKKANMWKMIVNKKNKIQQIHNQKARKVRKVRKVRNQERGEESID